MKLAIVALALLPISALAQAPPQVPAPSGTDISHPPRTQAAIPPTPAQSANPPHIKDMEQPGQAPADIDAMRHHQPTQAEVNEREKARSGNDAAIDQRNQQDDKKVDNLYQQLLGKPAPK